MADAPKQPYEVTDIKHERTFRPDGTIGGQYDIRIKHENGVESSFTVPEEGDPAHRAHEEAMRQVREAQEIKHLPAGHEHRK